MCYCAYEFLLIFVRVFLTAAGRRTGELVTLPGGRIIYSYHKRRRGGRGEGNFTQPLLQTTTVVSAHIIVGKMCFDHDQIHKN